MALKSISNNIYIKIDLNGNYYKYKNSQARQFEKEHTQPIQVSKKYYDLISKLRSDRELLYYDPTALKFVEDLEAEQLQYHRNAQRYITTGKYPLMKKYISDVEDSIPQIIDKGWIRVKGTTLEEIYEFVKKYKIFGETEDC